MGMDQTHGPFSLHQSSRRSGQQDLPWKWHGGYKQTTEAGVSSLCILCRDMFPSIVLTVDSYRLCKRDPKDKGSNLALTEECFQAGHLAFVGSKASIIGCEAANATHCTKPLNVEFEAMHTSKGTHPAGSMWARNPIPACDGPGGGAAGACNAPPQVHAMPCHAMLPCHEAPPSNKFRKETPICGMFTNCHVKRCREM